MKPKRKLFLRGFIVLGAVSLFVGVLPSGPKTFLSLLGTVSWLAVILIPITLFIQFLVPSRKWFNKRHVMGGIASLAAGTIFLVTAILLAKGRTEVPEWIAGIGLASLSFLGFWAINFLGGNILEKLVLENPWQGESPDDPTDMAEWSLNGDYKSEGRILLHGDQLVLIAQKGSSHQVDLKKLTGVRLVRTKLAIIGGIRLNLDSGSELILSGQSFPYFWKREILRQSGIVSSQNV